MQNASPPPSAAPEAVISAAAAGAAPGPLPQPAPAKPYMEADLERSRLYCLSQFYKGLIKFRSDR